MSGVAISSPIGPHNSVQKLADRMMDSGERPVRLPNTSGSATWPMNSSDSISPAKTMAAKPQPGSAASASTVGGTTAMGVPMKGTKRISPAISPHSSGLGSPTAHSPRPTAMP